MIQPFIEASVSLSANKLRSGLTMLGIVIGVAAVIAMLGIGTGTQVAVTKQIESIGVNLLFVSSGGDAKQPEPLTLQDAEALANPKLAPSVLRVAPVLQGQVTISIPGETTNTSLTGITSDYFQVQSVDIAEGIAIQPEHLENFASVVLLGMDTADNLFGRKNNLIGETIRIAGQPFKVIGVLAEAGGTSFGSSDNRILVPLSTAQARLVRRGSSDQVDLIYVQAASSEQVESASQEVAQILRARHRRNLGVDDFRIQSTQAFLDIASTITGTFTVFLGGIAGVSLLVGGIGIMNIMLVTVVERTREIGLRKAVGARRRDILTQFLIESSLLSLGGGVVGIALGYSIATLIGQIAANSGTPINPVVDANSILLATLFSAGVGLFFGLYPANRAARLEPVEALRSE